MSRSNVAGARGVAFTSKALCPVAIACVVFVAFVVGCGGRTSTSTPSNRAASPPDAAPSGGSCYPYAKRDGACLTKCDWSKPDGDEGCAHDDYWSLICNKDGTCTPEQNFD